MSYKFYNKKIHQKQWQQQRYLKKPTQTAKQYKNQQKTMTAAKILKKPTQAAKVV